MTLTTLPDPCPACHAERCGDCHGAWYGDRCGCACYRDVPPPRLPRGSLAELIVIASCGLFAVCLLVHVAIANGGAS